MFLSHRQDNEVRAETNGYRHDAVRHHFATNSQASLTQDAVEWLTRERVPRIANGIHKGPDLNCALEEKILFGQFGQSGERQEGVGSGPPS